MQSEIDQQLNKEEKEVLELYRNPQNSDMRRQIRLSLQYLISTAIFLGLAIFLDDPWYAMVIFFIFAMYLMIRIRGAKKIVGIMPRIIEKYERTIRELRKRKRRK